MPWCYDIDFRRGVLCQPFLFWSLWFLFRIGLSICIYCRWILKHGPLRMCECILAEVLGHWSRFPICDQVGCDEFCMLCSRIWTFSFSSCRDQERRVVFLNQGRLKWRYYPSSLCHNGTRHMHFHLQPSSIRSVDPSAELLPSGLSPTDITRLSWQLDHFHPCCYILPVHLQCLQALILLKYWTSSTSVHPLRCWMLLITSLVILLVNQLLFHRSWCSRSTFDRALTSVSHPWNCECFLGSQFYLPCAVDWSCCWTSCCLDLAQSPHQAVGSEPSFTDPTKQHALPFSQPGFQPGLVSDEYAEIDRC